MIKLKTGKKKLAHRGIAAEQSSSQAEANRLIDEGRRKHTLTRRERRGKVALSPALTAAYRLLCTASIPRCGNRLRVGNTKAVTRVTVPHIFRYLPVFTTNQFFLLPHR